MAMKREQDARAAPDCRKLDMLADVCRMFLAAERRKEAAAAVAAGELACKKRKSPPLSPPSLRLPPPTGPAPSDFHPRFRDVSSCQKKPAESSSDPCPATLLGPASKKIKLKIVFPGAGAASSSCSSSSVVPSSGDGPLGSWEVEHARLGGEQLVWIGEKLITGSDKTKSQSRLLVPQLLSERIFQQARDWESARINSGGMPVLVLDRFGRHHQMVCKFRASQNGMVFTGGWNEFVRINSLQIGDLLRIVAFRSADALCFAFLPRGQD